MFFSIFIANPAFSARTLCSFYSTLPSDYEEYDGSPRAAVDRIFYNISPWDNYPDESFGDYEETDPNGCPSYGITTNSAPEFIYSDENYNFCFVQEDLKAGIGKEIIIDVSSRT
jgi:hypothetical protein